MGTDFDRSLQEHLAASGFGFRRLEGVRAACPRDMAAAGSATFWGAVGNCTSGARGPWKLKASCARFPLTRGRTHGLGTWWVASSAEDPHGFEEAVSENEPGVRGAPQLVGFGVTEPGVE